MEKSKTILIIAGEASGDEHGAALIQEIKKLNPNINFFGLGGEKLQKEGVDIVFDLVNLAVVGISEVLKNLPKIHKIFKNIICEAEKRKPDCAILIDYPGFNLKLAQELHKRKIPVVYYISPQLWAWGAERIKIVQKNISKMIVFFPFEEELYKKNNVDVSFVGHPSLEAVKTTLSKKEFCKKFGLDENKFTICLLPGSRKKEVENLLPIMVETANLLQQNSKLGLQFIILRANTVDNKIFESIASEYKTEIKIITGETYNGVAASDFALVCSGTATLETAILNTPMVLLYKVNLLTWIYGKLLIKIPYIGLVNIVYKNKLIEEFIQFDATAEKISKYCQEIIRNKEKLNYIKTELTKIKASLGEPGASQKAAKAVIEFLKNLN